VRSMPTATDAEPIVGEDAIFLRFERPDTATHTLKVVILDPARRGAQITLADMMRVLPDYLDLSPRSRQRIGRMPGSRRWAWVRDDAFELPNHLDEVTVSAPGDRAGLDLLCSRITARQLDRTRPLWRMTLVHGLEGGRQAVVVQVHHAIADGMATMNLLFATTTGTGGATAPPLASSAPAADAADRRPGVRAVIRTARAARSNASKFETNGIVPGLNRRTELNARAGKDRLCASSSIELADLREIAAATGVSLNGAFHAVVAGALRDELRGRGLRSDRAQVAAFGVAEERNPHRRHGNDFATSFAYLHSEIADPLERLHRTVASAEGAIGLRRARGFASYRQGAEVAQYLAPHGRALFANITPLVGNQITLANVPGPTSPRRFGDVEVVDWISFAIAIAPALISLTAYSYNGRMSLGLIVAPEAMPDPVAFLGRIEAAIGELLETVRSASME
jgi:diacylglycerol O-acyltransferase